MFSRRQHSPGNYVAGTSGHGSVVPYPKGEGFSPASVPPAAQSPSPAWTEARKGGSRSSGGSGRSEHSRRPDRAGRSASSGEYENTRTASRNAQANSRNLPEGQVGPSKRSAGPSSGEEKRVNLAQRFRVFITLCEAIITIGSVVFAAILQVGPNDPDFQLGKVKGDVNPNLVGIGVAVLWLLSLRLFKSADPHILGRGVTEYSRIVRASVTTFGIFAILCVLTRYDQGFMFVAVAFPLGTLLLLLARYLWRLLYAKLLTRKQYRRRLIYVGGNSIAEVFATLRPSVGREFDVVGFCITDSHTDISELQAENPGAKTTHNWHNLTNLVQETGADLVVVTGSEHIGLWGMRELIWSLDQLGVELFVAPSVANVAAPRVTMQPIAGMPLIHVESPHYQRAHSLMKMLFDRIGALFLILLFSPILLACAIAIKLDDGGPIFYVAERMGLRNHPFGMIKFRSMVVNADKLVDGLKDQNEGNDVLFKMKDDPRVTKVGKFLRRYSLDELPQLFNVLKGDMSLVGPRPPLRSEVEQYEGLVGHRMLVLPGMTDLWQVSGRSNLSWEESVSLDLYYVENWSFMQDLQILWKTGRAVLTSDGAY